MPYAIAAIVEHSAITRRSPRYNDGEEPDVIRMSASINENYVRFKMNNNGMEYGLIRSYLNEDNEENNYVDTISQS